MIDRVEDRDRCLLRAVRAVKTDVPKHWRALLVPFEYVYSRRLSARLANALRYVSHDDALYTTIRAQCVWQVVTDSLFIREPGSRPCGPMLPEELFSRPAEQTDF